MVLRQVGGVWVTDQPRILATIDGRSGYDGLIAMFRARIIELGTHMEAVDEVAGLPTRYTGKLLNKSGGVVRRHGRQGIGRESFGPLLGTLAIKLVAMVDDAADYKIKQGLNGLRQRGTKGTKIAKPDAKPAFAQFGKIGRAKYLLVSSSAKRSMSARIAACARWQQYRAKQARLARRRFTAAQRRELRKKLMEAQPP